MNLSRRSWFPFSVLRNARRWRRSPSYRRYVLPPRADDRGANSYEQHNLVSDGLVAADDMDRNLVDGWGIASNANGSVLRMSANRS